MGQEVVLGGSESRISMLGRGRFFMAPPKSGNSWLGDEKIYFHISLRFVVNCYARYYPHSPQLIQIIGYGIGNGRNPNSFLSAFRQNVFISAYFNHTTSKDLSPKLRLYDTDRGVRSSTLHRTQTWRSLWLAQVRAVLQVPFLANLAPK
jgi:hypothetical protein